MCINSYTVRSLTTTATFNLAFFLLLLHFEGEGTGDGVEGGVLEGGQGQEEAEPGGGDWRGAREGGVEWREGNTRGEGGGREEGKGGGMMEGGQGQEEPAGG